MTEPVVAAYVIGQTPRADLTDDLVARFPGVRFEMHGALDGLERKAVLPCGPDDYPLETNLGDGDRVVVGARFLSPLLQEAINRAGDVAAHLVLCAGPFPELTPPPSSLASASFLHSASSLGSAPTLVRPFEVGTSVLVARGYQRLDVLVPFADQAGPAADKWAAAGFTCRVHVFTDKAQDRSLADWLSGRVGESDAEALVFDYVGFPSTVVETVDARLDVPVYDLGQLAMDALAEILDDFSKEPR